MRLRGGVWTVLLGVCLAAAGCAGMRNVPANLPTAAPLVGDAEGIGDFLADDDVMLGLAFSGGGTRAAAFSFGVLKQLARMPLPYEGRPLTMIDRVDIVTGVSGGSVTAAYFGLRRRAALDDFRERFLVRDAEAALNTAVSFGNIARAFGGGVNGDVPLRRWLDANLFGGATFGNLLANQRPHVVINASDLYNRTPFVFTPATFAALCSDISSYPLSAAVAASAAVPLAFAPVVLATYPESCKTPLPPWVVRARDDPEASPMVKAVARGLTRYRDGAMRYVKLVDGGVVDNFGLSSFTVVREAAQTPYGPLTPAHGVKLRRILFIVVDSEQAVEGDWVSTLDGPSGVELITASANAALASSVWSSYSAFQLSLRKWRDDLVRWRCSLSAGEVARLRGSTAGWNCRDVEGFIGRVAFDQLEPERAAMLNAVPTRFRLPPEQVDALIEAGGDAVARHPSVRAFLKSLGAPAPISRTVAAAEPVTPATPVPAAP
ncbi:patatin-like phospholipase family protein [Rhodoplanes serenus]|jgi:NTE family protein|uniref:Patatin-like phospholipase family protein n=1 Tax=Rhodoplanes serenus TaxID=200615 RepID=A0A9X4XSS6_9BRAD|nr:patatin-like phospholipase family protein [Rhodoplanes serenus]MTW18041.1 patatin-like phospholipase family protein [Rhodoplanes serenus]